MAYEQYEFEKTTKLWVNAHERQDGSRWYSYAISTSSKDKDGNYVNKSLPVRMTKAVEIPSDLANGETVTIRGFLSNESFTDRNGEKRIEHILVAQEVDFQSRTALKSEPADSFSAAEDDIPF